MAWKSKSALRREYKNNDASRKNLGELFAIRQFLRFGLRTGSFSLSKEATDAICLTPSGTELLDRLGSFNQENQTSLGKFAVFLTFFHQQLLVDVDNTKPGPLRELVHRNVLGGGLRYPWLFDHILYDRSFDQFAEVAEHVSKEETERLLCDTPPGVFQLGTLSVGPFGLLESEQSRLFRPRSDILLSHCSDATCNHAHVAMIYVGGGPVSGITSSINKILQQAGDPSEYQEFVAELQVGYSWYDDFAWKNLPWLLGNAFSEPEVRTLLAEVITTRQAQIRSRFPTDNPAASRLKGSAVDIASWLSKPEALQIMMLASDETIVAAIDALVQRGGIAIPPSETRVAMASAETYSWNRVHCECSQLGVRVVSRQGHQPLARLRRLILQAYPSVPDRKQLAWMLGRASAVGGIQEDTLGREVERFILEKSPGSVIRELVFASHEKLVQALTHLGAAHFDLPTNRSEDRQLVNRILWKLGFPRTHFGSRLEAFYEKLTEFEKAASSSQSRMEDWKENVRAAGVNCFAVVEEILDLSLAFSAWLLCSDHFAEKHVFDLRRARVLVSEELSGVIQTEDGPLELSPGGDNTLFPLVAGFLALAQRSSELLQNVSKYRKPEVLLAHYTHDSTLQVFPYKHQRFLFDACKEELDRTISLLQTSGSSLQRSSVITVRNGVIHPKQKFPTRSDIDSCCVTLRETVQALEQAGLVPTLFATVKVENDGFGRHEITSVNYGDRHLKWSPSPALHVIRSLPSVRDPQVIVPSLHLPDTAEVLRFSVEEDSDYREMWRNYPRRRAPSKEDIEETEGRTEPQPTSLVAGSEMHASLRGGGPVLSETPILDSQP